MERGDDMERTRRDTMTNAAFVKGTSRDRTRGPRACVSNLRTRAGRPSILVRDGSMFLWFH